MKPFLMEDDSSHASQAGVAPGMHLTQILPFTTGDTEAETEKVGWLQSHSEWQRQDDT